jgi:hypothetical protein
MSTYRRRHSLNGIIALVSALAIPTLGTRADTSPYRAGAAPRSPAGRTGAALVYDASRKTMVLWGGLASDGESLPNDLWEWNGRSWRPRTPTDGVAPNGRAFHNLVYDAARRRIVMFGGRPAPARGDIWEWDGARWHEITTDTLSILHATAAYDAARRRIVLFGGVDHTGLLRKVMEWDGRAWRVLESVGPPVGAETGIPVVSAVSPAGHLIAVMEQSGRSSDSVALLTWTWNGTSWTRRELGPAMTSLQPAASAPDGTIYIYQSSGEWLTAPLVHTRSPAGSWTSVSPPMRAEEKGIPAAAYDADRKRFVIYGNEFWEWEGAQWVKRP